MKPLLTVFVALVASGVAFAAFQSGSAVGSAPSPLAAYPGFGHNAVADEARYRTEERNRENLIVRCMKKEGFLYVASPSVAVDAGVTKAQLWALIEADPNRRYSESLGPERVVSYNLALAGVPDANAPGLNRVGGCVGAAHAAIPGVYAAYGALLEPFERLQSEIAVDSRVVAAEETWAACMRQLGFAFRSPSALRASFDERRSLGHAPTEVARLKAEHARALGSGAACEQSSGLEAGVAAARVEHETAFVQRHREVLERHPD